MSSVKDGKILRVLEQIEVIEGQTDYLITSDPATSVFLYREDRLQFVELNPADYTIVEDQGNTYLRITNSTLLETMLEIQVAEEVTTDSSRYELAGDVDIDILKDLYNELVDDHKGIYSYINAHLKINDNALSTAVLPRLNNGQTWAYNADDDAFYAIQVDDIIDILAEVTELRDEVIDLRDETITIKDEATAEADRAKSEADRAKLEADRATQDRGIIISQTDLRTLLPGNWYTFDISDTVNAPEIVGLDLAGQISMTWSGYDDPATPTDAQSKVLRFSNDTEVWFATYNPNTLSWSDWHKSSSGDDLSYSLNIPAHGFTGVVALTDTIGGGFQLADTTTGVDFIGIVIDADTLQLVLTGVVEVPEGLVDDLGNPLVENEFYFLSQTVAGGFQRDKPTSGIHQAMFKYFFNDSLGAYAILVDIDDPIDVTPTVLNVDNEPISVATVGYVDTEVSAVQTQVDDHETRVTSLETNDAIQDGKLATLPVNNTDGLPNGTDLNDVVTSMTVNVYGGDNLVNLPFDENGSAGTLEVLRVDRDVNSRVIQRYYRTNTRDHYYRCMDDVGVWQPWSKVVTINEEDSVIDIQGYNIHMETNDKIINTIDSGERLSKFRGHNNNTFSRQSRRVHFNKSSGGRGYWELCRFGADSGNADGRLNVVLTDGVDIGVREAYKFDCSLLTRGGVFRGLVNVRHMSGAIDDSDKTSVLVTKGTGNNYHLWIGICDFGPGSLDVDSAVGVQEWFVEDGQYRGTGFTTTRPSDVVWDSLTQGG